MKHDGQHPRTEIDKLSKRASLRRSHTTLMAASTDTSLVGQVRPKSSHMVNQDLFEINKRVSRAFTKDNLNVEVRNEN